MQETPSSMRVQTPPARSGKGGEATAGEGTPDESGGKRGERAPIAGAAGAASRFFSYLCPWLAAPSARPSAAPVRAAASHANPTYPTHDMLNPLLKDKELFALLRIIQDARRVVICGHRGPDGDAMGSALGWAEYLRGLGKETTVVMPTPCPDFLRWMPGAKDVLFYNEKREAATKAIEAADLICCLDFNALGRLQEMAPVVERSKARRIMIDHHIGPDRDMAEMVVSHPEKSSTSELVFRLIHQLGGFESMTRGGAACIYAGMMTDTGGFTYASNDPEIYLIISLLLTKRIDKDKIYRHVYNNYSENRLRFTGYILYEKLRFLAGRRASLFSITREEMKRFRFIRGDAEGLVNMPLQVKGMRLSISLREDTDKEVIRVSLRSVDDFPCNRMAEEFFNGGGHLNAAGGELPFPLEEAEKTAERAVEAYAGLLWPATDKPPRGPRTDGPACGAPAR